MTADLPRPFDHGDVGRHLHDILAALRADGPVRQVRTAAGRPMWLVLGHDEVRAAFVDQRLSVQGPHPPSRRGLRRAMDVSLMNYDGLDHRRIRALARYALSSRRAEDYRERIAGAARHLLATLPRHEPVDLMAAFARPFAFTALAEVFAIPAAERPALYQALLCLFDRAGRSMQDVEAAADQVEALVRDLLRERAERSSSSEHGSERCPDLPADLLRAWTADGGIDPDELVSLTGMLLLAGFDSTAQMIGICVLALDEQPELGAALRDGSVPLPQLLDELLRWDTPGPFSTPRSALADVELGGVTIPRGSRVILSVAAADRDPATFPDPERIDVARPRDARHLAFGLGPHTCPGAALARIELAEALRAVFTGAPSLRPATDPASLHWVGGHQHRRLSGLPVVLGPAPAG